MVWTTTMDLSNSKWKRALAKLISAGMREAFDEGLAALKREAERQPAFLPAASRSF